MKMFSLALFVYFMIGDIAIVEMKSVHKITLGPLPL
jgi:D-hexose-6-phosphate mutarotase